MKHEITYSVDARIFERFPAYTRALVVAHDLSNEPTSSSLTSIMRNEEGSVRARVDINGLPEDPRFRPWRDAFSWFGSKPSDYRSAAEALARRVLRGQQLPAISSLVDIGTIICLRYLVPVGGHALDDVSDGISLRKAIGDEVFMPFNSDTPEHAAPGEVILVEGSRILTRRWVWRQGAHTLLTSSTRAAFYNLDILRETSPDEIVAMSDDLSELLRRYCKGRVSVRYLTAATPSVRIGFD